MNTTTLRVLRLLGDESLDSLGDRLGFKKNTLSLCERFPYVAGPKLRKSLERCYGLPWSILEKPVAGKRVARVLIQSLQES